MWKANQTFDTEFLNHIDTYCDQLLFDYEKQNWDKVEREVHRDFDAQFGVKEVSRHLAEFKRPFVK